MAVVDASMRVTNSMSFSGVHLVTICHHELCRNTEGALKASAVWYKVKAPMVVAKALVIMIPVSMLLFPVLVVPMLVLSVVVISDFNKKVRCSAFYKTHSRMLFWFL
jgi:hypothetical protein